MIWRIPLPGQPDLFDEAAREDTLLGEEAEIGEPRVAVRLKQRSDAAQVLRVPLWIPLSVTEPTLGDHEPRSGIAALGEPVRVHEAGPDLVGLVANGEQQVDLVDHAPSLQPKAGALSEQRAPSTPGPPRPPAARIARKHLERGRGTQRGAGEAMDCRSGSMGYGRGYNRSRSCDCTSRVDPSGDSARAPPFTTATGASVPMS